MLIPGGTPFGVRFYTEGALVYRLEEGSPAEKAGLKAGASQRRKAPAPFGNQRRCGGLGSAEKGKNAVLQGPSP